MTALDEPRNSLNAYALKTAPSATADFLGYLQEGKCCRFPASDVPRLPSAQYLVRIRVDFFLDL